MGALMQYTIKDSLFEGVLANRAKKIRRKYGHRNNFNANKVSFRELLIYYKINHYGIL